MLLVYTILKFVSGPISDFNPLLHSSATWVNIHPGVNLVEIRGEMEFWEKSVTKSGLLNFSMTSVTKRGLLKFPVISVTKNKQKVAF